MDDKVLPKGDMVSDLLTNIAKEVIPPLKNIGNNLGDKLSKGIDKVVDSLIKVSNK